jgi:DNA recombination protein RmuC
LQETYDDAVKLLCTGKGNLIAQAAQFRELGVSVSKELPAELVKIAKLELEHGTELLEVGQGQ